ncbi:Pex12 amino terminal region-domain-containing protein [Blyttiomyces helicus]|uniref:Peroxisome assembly protein 12 n=1 Tax=Blyttiomyces helicus TaxID=388810 RepID=A0A4P9WI31_9FUNG|nr:Pex12 amino terminal region-domain-containing protein [Blyttiomyces helicus]|eukprot:RKO91523.1 Pex12 amino terminal region-domain-containing protein [Blyttiomyces helicus]
MEFLSNLGTAGDIHRPSVFELVAQEKMRDLLRPALRYLLSVYAQRYPRYLLRLVNNHDELYAILTLAVERHYLGEWGASFPENFYGLKRVSVGKVQSRSKGPQPLTRSETWLSLFFLVGVPYLKSKLDEAYEKVSGGSGARIFGNVFAENNDASLELEPLPVRMKKHTKATFKAVYPYINGAYQAAIFLYQIGYMYGKTEFYSPWLHLAGLKIRRMSMKDYVTAAARVAALSSASRLQWARHLLAVLVRRGFDFLKYALPMSIFFFKFLEWWYSSEYHKQGGARPIPPPPDPVAPHPEGIPLPEDLTVCALCLKKRTNPTMVPSGFVFCYPCIFRHVEEHEACPVTLVKTSTEQLRKIYSAA